MTQTIGAYKVYVDYRDGGSKTFSFDTVEAGSRFIGECFGNDDVVVAGWK